MRATIETELGLDILKYRNEEVADNLMDLLLFPKYLLRWVGRPMLLAILLFIIGFFIIDLVHIQYIIYGALGLILFLLLGLFLGIMNLGRKISEDVTSISEYSLGLMKNSILDVKNMGGRVNQSNIKDVLGMLFKGVIFVVTIPMVNKAIEKKLPLGKGFAKRIISGALSVFASRITFDPDKVDENMVKVDGESKIISNYVSAVDQAKKGSSSVIRKALKIAVTPFRLGLYIVAFLLIILIYSIW